MSVEKGAGAFDLREENFESDLGIGVAAHDGMGQAFVVTDGAVTLSAAHQMFAFFEIRGEWQHGEISVDAPPNSQVIRFQEDNPRSTVVVVGPPGEYRFLADAAAAGTIFDVHLRLMGADITSTSWLSGQ